MDKLRAGTFKFLENWTFKTVDKETGKILSSEDVSNAIVNAGLERVARLIMGDSSTYFRAIAIGVGTTAVSNTDTALESENTRAAATLTYVTDYKAKFAYTFTFSAPYAITEAGIFDSVTPSGSGMLSRLVFPAKNVSATVSLIAEATITVSRV